MRIPRIPAAGRTSRSVRASVASVPRIVTQTAHRALTTPVPLTLDQQAHQYAQHDIDALLAGIPSQQTIQQPYDQRNSQIDAMTQGLIDQLRGAQTYRVNLATGLPEAQKASDAASQQQANQSAAALGGTASTLPTGAASALSSFGTSAANEIAQQQAVAPYAGMQYHSQINQALLNALNQRTQAVTEAGAKLPSLEDQYRQQLTQAKQSADQLAFQQRVAQQNYDLATGKASSDLGYKYAALGEQGKRTAATIAAENARAAASRDSAWKIAQARINAQKASAGASATKARGSSLAAAERYVDSNIQSRYKPTAGTPGSVSGYVVSWKGTPDPTDPLKPAPGGSRSVKPEQWQAYVASGKKDPTLLGLKPEAIVGTATKIAKPGTAGKGATNPDIAVNWAKGYLARQNTAYGWGLSDAEMTRMAQQSVRDSGLWPNYAKNTRSRTPAPRSNSAPGRS